MPQKLTLGQLSHPLDLACTPPASIDEQRLIGEVVNTHEVAVLDLDRQLGKVRLMKSGLMSDLLTGRVRVKVAEESMIVNG